MLCKALGLAQGYGKVTVEWFALEESRRPIPQLMPGIVPIVPSDANAQPVTIWPPRPQAVRKNRARPRQEFPDESQPGMELLALEDEGDGDDDGDADIAEASSEEGGFADQLDELTDCMMDIEAPDLEGDASRGNTIEANPPSNAAAAADIGSLGGGDGQPSADGPIGDDRHRAGASITMQVPGGSISYYPSKNAFEAVCEQKGHGRCVLTRTSKGRCIGRTGKMVGGRPVGFLAAWLSHGEQLATKADHWAGDAVARPLAERQSLRTQIAESGQSGRLLLSFEREQSPGEPAEPETLEGLAGGGRA